MTRIFQGQGTSRDILVRHEQGGRSRRRGAIGALGPEKGPWAGAGDVGRAPPHGDADDERADGFDPAVCITGAGADAPDRQLERSRKCGPPVRGHHPALHQAQLAGARRQRSAKVAATRRSMSQHRPSWAVWVDVRKGCASGFRGSAPITAAQIRLCTCFLCGRGSRGATRADSEKSRGRAGVSQARPGDLHRRRRHQIRLRGSKGCCASWSRPRDFRSPPP